MEVGLCIADGAPVIVLLWIGLVILGLAVGVLAARDRRRDASHRAGLQVAELRRLHRAELAVAHAPTHYAAAKELAGHVLALVDAPVAAVLIEGRDDNVRVIRGDGEATSVYEPGSKMRLLEVGGVPVGSIAVAARIDGEPYGERDEQVLDALAQRVSATLLRLALADEVQVGRGSLADVLDASSDAIAAVGPELRVEGWNPAMARLTGTSAEDAIGRPCCAVFRPVGEDGAPRHGADCPCRLPEATEALLSVTGPAGQRWLLTAFSPRPGGGSVVVGRDVTARKQLDDDKADFLATVSHELRTPLTPLKGFIHTLASRGEELTPEDRGHVYRVLLREEQRLERLVDQLLQATTMEHGHAERVASFDWTAVVGQRLDAFLRRDPSRELEVDLPEAPVLVHADPDGAGHLLEELLANAAKFTPTGSPMRLEVAVVDEQVVTTVEDAGAGVAPADRERIFERFTRLGDHLTRPSQGVGLGLYIVRRSLEAMGGSVTCEESSMGGAAFVVRLPAAASHPRDPATPPRSSPTPR